MEEYLPIKIMTVDDDADTLNLLKFMLNKRKYEVILAKSGEDALDILKGITPDLILLDVMMRGMDGYEVCNRIQSNDAFSFVPIIFLTAQRSEQYKLKAFSVGAVDFLTKPIGENRLFETIEKHLKTKENWVKNLKEKSESIIETSRSVVISSRNHSMESLHEGYSESTTNRIESEFETSKEYYPEDSKGIVRLGINLPARRIGTALIPGVKNFIGFKRFLSNILNINYERVANIVVNQLYSFLLSEFNIPNKDTAKYLSHFMGIDYLAEIDPDSIELGVIPISFSKKNLVVALKGDKATSFLITNPFDITVLDSLSKFRPERILITEPEKILDIFVSSDTTFPEGNSRKSRQFYFDNSEKEKAFYKLFLMLKNRPLDEINALVDILKANLKIIESIKIKQDSLN